MERPEWQQWLRLNGPVLKVVLVMLELYLIDNVEVCVMLYGVFVLLSYRTMIPEMDHADNLLSLKLYGEVLLSLS